MAPLIRTGGSRHTGLAALPHRNIQYAYIPFGILFIITMYWALKVEKLKKKNDIQTYKEIVAFTEGKKLDELHKAVEVGKRPYQNILKVIISAGVTAMICFLIGVLMHVFLN